MLSSIFIFLVVLSILIISHELGHFIMAKKAGIWVEEFGIGIPPRIYGKKIGETIYSINLLPFGGFVRLHGENTEEQITKPKKAFLNKSKKVRVLVIIAGVIMNFIVGIVSFAVVYSFLGIPIDTENVKVVEVVEGAPASLAGIDKEDIIRKVGDIEITSTNQFAEITAANKGGEIVVTYEKPNGTYVSDVLVPRLEYPENQGPLGVAITTSDVYFPQLWKRPFVGIYYGFREAVFWGLAVIGGFIQIIYDLFKGQAPKDIAGPVGIFAITSQAAQYGTFALINFVGVLSVNLAIFNIIPFPALDGGRLFFLAIEGLIGKRILPKVEAAVHAVGLIILIFVLIAITAHDIQRWISAGSISGFIDSVLR